MKIRELPWSLLFFLFLGGFLFVLPASAEAAASLSFSPSKQTVEMDQIFTIALMVDTGGSNTDAVDAIAFYDTGRLVLVSSVLGDLYDNKLINDYSTIGKIVLRATSSSGKYFSGSGVFATLTFRSKAVGTGAVNFFFSANSTTDSNVAYNGSDILGSVENGLYTVVAAGEGTSPPASPTPTSASRVSLAPVSPVPTLPKTGIFGLTLGAGIMGLVFLVLGSLVISL